MVKFNIVTSLPETGYKLGSIMSEVSHAFRFLQPLSSLICSRLILREPGNAQQTSRPIGVVSVWPGACLAVG